MRRGTEVLTAENGGPSGFIAGGSEYGRWEKDYLKPRGGP